MDLACQAQFYQILTIPQVSLQQIKNKQVIPLQQGVLILGEFPQTKTHAIMLNGTQFVIFKQMPFYVSEFSASRVYIFNQDGNNYSLQILKNNSELISLLEKCLSEIATILYNSVHMFTGEEAKEEDPTKDNKMAGMIKMGGNFISSGIKIGAQTASKGINIASSYLKQTEKQENVNISDDTKSKIKKVQSGTGEVVQLTTQVTGALVDLQISLAKAAANKISENLDKNESGEKDPKLEYLRQVGRQSLASCLDVLDSMDEAVELVGGTIGENAEEVIQHRYGEDAAECAKISAECAKNSYGVYKNAKKVGYKSLAKAQGKAAASELGKKI